MNFLNDNLYTIAIRDSIEIVLLVINIFLIFHFFSNLSCSVSCCAIYTHECNVTFLSEVNSYVIAILLTDKSFFFAGIRVLSIYEKKLHQWSSFY